MAKKRERSHSTSSVDEPILQDISQNKDSVVGKRGRKTKKYIPEEETVSETEHTLDVAEDAEVSETELKREDPKAVENALVAEGSALSGKALRDFLQKNFTDFADENLIDFDKINF